MGKFCPIVGHDVVYLVCQECEDRVCEQNRPRVTVLPKKETKIPTMKKNVELVRDDRCRGNCESCETCHHMMNKSETVLGHKIMEIVYCEVRRNYLIDPVKVSHEGCEYHNKDMSNEKICMNCKKYLGGSDWGLSCAQNYHTLTTPMREACEHFDKRD